MRRSDAVVRFQGARRLDPPPPRGTARRRRRPNRVRSASRGTPPSCGTPSLCVCASAPLRRIHTEQRRPSAFSDLLRRFRRPRARSRTRVAIAPTPSAIATHAAVAHTAACPELRETRARGARGHAVTCGLWPVICDLWQRAWRMARKPLDSRLIYSRVSRVSSRLCRVVSCGLSRSRTCNINMYQYSEG